MIRTEREGGVLRLVLARADKRNALTRGMLDDLADALAANVGDQAKTPAAQPDEEPVRVVLLCGEGKTFCAGFDLELCATEEGAVADLLRGLSAATGAFRAAPVPVVAAVQGAAVAGGCALLGGADVVVVERSAKFGYPVLRIGVSPAVSVPFLRRHTGDGVARARAVDPGLIGAEEALRVGLVHEIVEDGRALARGMEIARELAAKPSGGARATRRWLNELEALGDEAERGLAASLSLAGGDEQREMLGRAWGR